MPSLILFIYESTKGLVSLEILLLALALIFSWIGDIALLQENEIYFVIGLGAFLITHLIYIVIYYKVSIHGFDWRPIASAPMLMYSSLLLYNLLPKTGDLMIPVVVYAVVITAMALVAITRKANSATSFFYILIGSILFVLSDSLIAWNKFVVSISFANVLIMATYITAQYLIAKGVLLAYKKKYAYLE